MCVCAHFAAYSIYKICVIREYDSKHTPGGKSQMSNISTPLENVDIVDIVDILDIVDDVENVDIVDNAGAY